MGRGADPLLNSSTADGPSCPCGSRRAAGRHRALGWRRAGGVRGRPPAESARPPLPEPARAVRMDAEVANKMAARIRHLERHRVDPIQRVHEQVAYARAGFPGRLHANLRSVKLHRIEGHGSFSEHSEPGVPERTDHRVAPSARRAPRPRVHTAERGLLKPFRPPLGLNQALQYETPE